ncbi:MAG: hypothetical protein OEW58_11450 [Gammaproteobacteria bacterium]|nr:hypothetical protein [Gammaproteobacteria bacterium]
MCGDSSDRHRRQPKAAAGEIASSGCVCDCALLEKIRRDELESATDAVGLQPKVVSLAPKASQAKHSG